MARASRGDIGQKANSPFARKLLLLMGEQPITTQAQLADITGKTRQTISQYVNGISEPGYDTLVKIADHFHVSLDFLLGRSEVRTTDSDIQDIVAKTGLTEENAKMLMLWSINPIEQKNNAYAINLVNSCIRYASNDSVLRDYLATSKANDIGRDVLCKRNAEDSVPHFVHHLNAWIIDSERARDMFLIRLGNRFSEHLRKEFDNGKY